MSSPETPNPETPEARFVRIKNYYQEAVDRGAMNGGPFNKIFSGLDPATLTHDDLNRVGRRMDEHWVGDTRNRDRR